jgi:deoxycytidine triphosphate deaminase
MSDVYVEVPAGVAAKLIIRSTLNRNGIFLTSGLYDAGFKGNLGFVLHNRAGEAYLAPGTRVGQIEFYKSDSEGLYLGGYNTKEGQHWSEKSEKK